MPHSPTPANLSYAIITSGLYYVLADGSIIGKVRRAATDRHRYPVWRGEPLSGGSVGDHQTRKSAARAVCLAAGLRVG